MKLLTTANPKLAKGEPVGYLSAVLHLAPADLSGFNVCPMATRGCKAACLNTAGRGGILKRGETTNAIQRARIARTQWLFSADRAGFLAALHREIAQHVKRAERLGLKPAVRLNGTSDIRWEVIAPSLFDAFPNVQFYDYTKLFNRLVKGSAWTELPANYRLTYSFDEREGSAQRAVAVLETGGNVAVVFRDKVTRARYMREGWLGFPVIDGDETDLRFTDPPGSVVGLYAKGRARTDQSGFVVD